MDRATRKCSPTIRVAAIPSGPNRFDRSLLASPCAHLLEADEPSFKQLESLAIPGKSQECSWKDYVAVASCLGSFGVAMSVVFVQEWAVYWSLNGQFIWVGLCLTIMSWCTQLYVRRLFLVAAIHFRSSSTLQTLDAILRSDPLASKANWASRILLVGMLAVAPALSAAYKSLGTGTSSFATDAQSIQVGLTGPPGTQRIGFGLSQFVNATLPWFESPGLDCTYGFNLYVVDENTTAVLDGPMPADIQRLQASLGSGQWAKWTGDVAALVCSYNPDLDYNRTALTNDFTTENNGTGEAKQQWAWNGFWNKGMYLPVKTNNTNIYFSAYNSSANQTFGENARHYEIVRQTYTATWHISPSSIQLETAAPKDGQRLNDQSVFTDTWASLAELFMPALVEYDTTFRQEAEATTAAELLTYRNDIKTDATSLALAVWARFVALLGPETWNGDPTQHVTETQEPTLLYSCLMSSQRGAVTIARDWRIVVVLLISPLTIFGSFLARVLLWPHSPIGGGFGVISLLSSVDSGSQPLLNGAGLSGRLRHPLQVTIWSRRPSAYRIPNAAPKAHAPIHGQITTSLGQPYTRQSRSLQRGAYYL